MAGRQGGAAKRYSKGATLTVGWNMGSGREAGDSGAGEVTVATGASTIGRGMFSMGMSSIEMWSVISLVSWKCNQLSWVSGGRKASSSA